MPGSVAKSVAQAGPGALGVEPWRECRRQINLLVPEQCGANRHEGDAGPLGRGPAGGEDVIANQAVDSQIQQHLREKL